MCYVGCERRQPVEGVELNDVWVVDSVELPFYKKKKEEEGLQGVFQLLRRNGHQLEKGLQMAQRGPSLK
jgi:hypothetical protein